MNNPEVLENIGNVLGDIELLTDPERPAILYDDLMDALIEDEDGWHLTHEGMTIAFVSKKAGREKLHDALYELSARFNGQRVHPHRNMGWLA